MDKKYARMENFSGFHGHELHPRSAKVEFKPIVIKKDNDDEQTKNEKMYLGADLFNIL